MTTTEKIFTSLKPKILSKKCSIARLPVFVMFRVIDKKLFSCLFRLCFLLFQINFFNRCVFVNGSSVISNPTTEFRLEIERYGHYNVSIFVENEDKEVKNLYHAIGMYHKLLSLFTVQCKCYCK